VLLNASTATTSLTQTEDCVNRGTKYNIQGRFDSEQPEQAVKETYHRVIAEIEIMKRMPEQKEV